MATEPEVDIKLPLHLNNARNEHESDGNASRGQLPAAASQGTPSSRCSKSDQSFSPQRNLASIHDDPR